MIKDQESVYNVNSTLQGEKVRMSIDDSALAHIMSVLTDLYYDPELAVVREYSTNAYDAHVQAGLDRPIEVTLPSNLAPFLRIRDYGEGLDAEDIRDIYSRYGASTKRETNELVGMLGLGCKSALTYTNQFTLVGIKNGIRTSVSVSRDEDGGGNMTIVEMVDTVDPSGVEIIIPVKDSRYLERKAQEFFKFWKPGTVLVNGETPDPIDGIWITDELLLSKEVDGPTIVMGNVAYKFEDYAMRRGRYWPVYFVEIGEVNFTPSREALQMTSKTKLVIARMKEVVRLNLELALNVLIAEATTPYEAIRLLKELRSEMAVNSGTFTYKNTEIPESYEAEKDKNFLVVRSRETHLKRNWDKPKRLPITTLPGSVWITGYDGAEFSVTKGKKLAMWARDNKITCKYFVFTDTIPDPTWINPAMIYNWTAIKDLKLPKDARSWTSGRLSGSYDIYEDGVLKQQVLAKYIDTSKPLFYYDNKYIPEWMRATIFHFHPSATIVGFTANRKNKFCRDFPTASNALLEINRLFSVWKQGLSEEDKITLAYVNRDRNYFRIPFDLNRMDIGKIDDPALKSFLTAARAKTSDKLRKEFAMFENMYGWGCLGEVKNAFTNYPLCSTFSYATMSENADHVYIYLNAVYAANKED